jgi:hypothetical protein
VLLDLVVDYYYCKCYLASCGETQYELMPLETPSGHGGFYFMSSAISAWQPRDFMLSSSFKVFVAVLTPVTVTVMMTVVGEESLLSGNVDLYLQY